MNRKFWLLRGLRFLLFAALFITAAGFITMYLWNWLVPNIFHGPVLNFAQAIGLLALSRLLLGGFRGGPGQHRWGRARWNQHQREWRQKMETRMAAMTPEEQEKFRQKMRASCGPPWMRRQASTEEPSVNQAV
ncbi:MULTISPECIES: hypothetical protein [Hymenobacter]|uniref:DUF1682 domain-containing protein n=1 Tax=Hymenobacter jejuensis TaxID=2502781 RepID=A0A5B7ZWP9_9BACT|nr:MULTISPECIES: hypothetical protein [Hymenobacter]MBC6988050.1 hypothetical protein [Hymenobacter sp. BT491]QDA59571.1 hypothetical protein FHG12_05375 [Hymenobacter jejuensis]